MSQRLPIAFFRRPTEQVARELIGQRLRHGAVLLEITETEAYPPGDSASHARFGRTLRNAPMWGAPGRAYVYLCYGMHHMLNLVSERTGTPGAVLIRACAPLEGLEVVHARRGKQRGVALLAGPGRVAQALGITRAFDGERVCSAGGLEVWSGEEPAQLLHGARVGIDYALPEDVRAPLRFGLAHSPWLSLPKRLRPLP